MINNKVKIQTIIIKHKGEFFAFLITLFFLVLNFVNHGLINFLAPILLLIGMVFPGIPHGAVDHYLSTTKRYTPLLLFQFIVKYLLMMGFVFLIWKVNSTIGLIGFILYSAWHFGETDFRRWEAFQPVFAFISGLSLLSFLLFTHAPEFSNYLQLFGINDFEFVMNHSKIISVICFLLYASVGLYSIKADKSGFIIILAILLLNIYLPLLLAFGIYFIVVHSTTGWNDIRKGLNLSHSNLILKALPFSLGAFFIITLFMFYYTQYKTTIIYFIPSFFIALSSLSAPHVIIMSKFYKNTLLVKENIN